MSSNFGYLDIILLGMIAGFIILRLRSILGRKTGHESKIYPVIGTTKKDRIIRSSKVEDIEIELIDWFELLEASMGKRLP